MLIRTMIASVLLIGPASCKGGGTASETTGSGSAVASGATAPAKAKGCAFLGEAAVKDVTGIAVTTHEHGNPQSCALFQTPGGKDYLLVATTGPSGYPIFLESNSPTMFPLRTPVAGVGTEAILLRWNDQPGAARTLIARNADRTVVLTPMPAGDTPPITDAQLTELARRSVATP